MNIITVSMKDLINFVAKNAMKEDKYNLLNHSSLMANLREYSYHNFEKEILFRWFYDYIPWNIINPLLSSIKVQRDEINIIPNSEFLLDAKLLIKWLDIDKDPYPWEKSKREILGENTDSILANNIDSFLRDFIEALETYCIDQNFIK